MTSEKPHTEKAHTEKAQTEESQNKRPGMKLRWRLLICLLFYGPAIYFKVDGDYIAAALCAVAGIGAFSGYRAGAVYIFAILAATHTSQKCHRSAGGIFFLPFGARKLDHGSFIRRFINRTNPYECF